MSPDSVHDGAKKALRDVGNATDQIRGILNESPVHAGGQATVEAAVYALSSAILHLQQCAQCDDDPARPMTVQPVHPEAFSCGISLISPHIFRAELPFLPLLKTKAVADRYTEIFLDLIHQKMALGLPSSFQKFDAAHVIFVNFVAQNEGKKQTYFDNDNLAIKALLDTIVPYICFDDAAKYCNNLYLYQPSNTDKSELYIVRKGHLKEWISSAYVPLFASEFTHENG